MDDGGRPAGIAVQSEVPNCPKVLRSKVVVLSVGEKAAESCQVCVMESNASEPLRKRRK